MQLMTLKGGKKKKQFFFLAGVLYASKYLHSKSVKNKEK